MSDNQPQEFEQIVSNAVVQYNNGELVREVVRQAINAAIAAEQTYGRAITGAVISAQDEIQQLREQLDAVQWCEVHAPTAEEPITCCPCCEAVHEREKLEEALAALAKIEGKP